MVERQRLREAKAGTVQWKRWDPYLTDRQRGTVREDYSRDGEAWTFESHDAARAKAS